MDIRTIKEQICDVCHKMWQLGWVAANDGNVSAKLEDGTFLATPTGMSKSFITPEKLIRIDARGNVLEAAEGLRPSSEIKMHLRCYEKRDEPYLEEHDVMLLENHGALAVGGDVVTAFYRMESLELWAKITINAVILGGSYDISRENIDKLIDLRGFYRVTGRHPGYKKYPRREKGAPTDT